MTLLEKTNLAHTQATQNLSRNIEALASTQPELNQWVAEQHLAVEWVFARDRALTALDEFGQWWSGNSLPMQSAKLALAKLEIRGSVACFLLPSHAAPISHALEKIRPEQAIIAIIPEMRDLAMILHCHDFSQVIQQHRLWFCAGAAWEIGMRSLLEKQSGLATPSQFIRTSQAETEMLEPVIAAAQKILSEITAERTQQLQSAQRRPEIRVGDKPCVGIIAPSRFRLWNDLGEAMCRDLDEAAAGSFFTFDTDDPLCSSPLAIASLAARAHAIVTANTSRTDLPGLIPESTPWITWVTSARIPSGAMAGEEDHLLLSHSALVEPARAGGWRADRLHLASWPPLNIEPMAGRSGFAILADTRSLETPKDLIEYSSQSLLWEAIRHELLRDPLCVVDPVRFLKDRARRANVGEDGIPTARFIEQLIIPAYTQGIARIMLAAKIPVRLYGRGWSDLSDFSSFAAGPIDTREQFETALRSSSALIHVWPGSVSHPIDACTLPVIRPAERIEKFHQQLKNASRGQFEPTKTPPPPFSAGMLLQILSSTSPWRAATMKQ